MMGFYIILTKNSEIQCSTIQQQQQKEIILCQLLKPFILKGAQIRPGYKITIQFKKTNKKMRQSSKFSHYQQQMFNSLSVSQQ